MQIVPGPPYTADNAIEIDRSERFRSTDLVFGSVEEGEDLGLEEIAERVKAICDTGLSIPPDEGVDFRGATMWQAINEDKGQWLIDLSIYLRDIHEDPKLNDFDNHLRDLLADACCEFDEDDSSWTKEKLLKVLGDLVVRNVGRDRNSISRAMLLAKTVESLPSDSIDVKNESFQIPVGEDISLIPDDGVVRKMWTDRLVREFESDLNAALARDASIESIVFEGHDLTEKTRVVSKVSLDEEGASLTVKLHVEAKPEAQLSGRESALFYNCGRQMVKLSM